MTIKHDDRILELSAQWISMEDIIKEHGGDKQEVIQAVGRLENTGIWNLEVLKIQFCTKSKIKFKIVYSFQK